MPFDTDPEWLQWSGGVFAFLCMLGVTPLVIRLAQRRGWLAYPKADRWHEHPTALMGGIAIYASAAFTAVVFAAGTLPWPIWAGATILFVAGLVDDLRNISPASKLVAQVTATGLLIAAGYVFGPDWAPWISLPLTFFWVIGITNALNLLDNMDGLAAGVAGITAVVLGIFATFTGNVGCIAAAAAVAGASFGFLVFNFNPARIFMGDSGSLFLGYSVAALTVVIHAETDAVAGFTVYLVAAAALAVPIFDTTLVTIVRTLSGRAVSQGGRDHSSHRLVFLGLSERQAVLTLYGISLLFGGLALLFHFAGVKLFLALAVFLVLGLVVFGTHLAEAKVYTAEARGEETGSGVPKYFALLHAFFGGRNWKSAAAVLADLMIVGASLVLAYELRFEAGLTARREALLFEALPVIVVLKILVFFHTGLYQNIWRHAGTPEIVRIVRATIVASVLTFAALTLLQGWGRVSRGVVFIDWMITTLAVTGIRFGFRGLRQYFSSKRRGGRRVLLYGVGDAGLLSLRELRQNTELGLQPVGFIDDNPLKRGLSVQGLSVLGAFSDLERVCEHHRVEEVIITAFRMTQERRAQILEECRRIGVDCRVFQLSFTRPASHPDPVPAAALETNGA